MSKITLRWRAPRASRAWAAVGAALVLLAAPESLVGGTVGRVVAIGGHASDLALDEGRGVLYVSNFTANRVEVISARDGSIQSAINVAAQPSSLALSPDGRHLLVAHFGAFQNGATNNGLTVIDLNSNARQSFALGSAPLGVAFGVDSRALVATSTEFLLFDPVTGNTETIGQIGTLTTKSLPQPVANFPANIVAASMSVSGDGLYIFGSAATGEGTSGQTPNQVLEFVYSVTTRSVNAVLWTFAPTPGPRAVSANFDGSLHMTGWAMHDRNLDIVLNQLPNASGIFEIGTHVFDNVRGRIYGQFAERLEDNTQTRNQRPVLLVMDADNLAVRERLLLPENFSGKSVLNAEASMMYGVSASGVLMVPVGDQSQVSRVVATREDIVFRGNACDRRVASQEITIFDPSGRSTDFTISVNTPGVTVSPTSGFTPATIRVNVDPSAFQNQKGTVVANLQISSAQAANLPKAVRVLINNREPDQRGTAVNVAGRLVDLLADPVRDRFYVLRQDTNEVLVFDGASQTQIATLRTLNTPTQMAVTFDRRWLMVGHDNAQAIKVFDLETLEESLPIRMPSGHYPRSIAASGRAILVASRVAGPEHKISRVDFLARTATTLPSLGVFENKIEPDTILIASPNGRSIFAAQANGTVYLYDSNVDSFTISRKDRTILSGAYAASSFDQFVIGDLLLNASLVPVAQFETASGRNSGFVFLDQGGFRTTAPNASSAGIIQRIGNSSSGQLTRSTRMVEAPILSEAVTTQATTGNVAWRQIFTRSVQPLYSRNAIVNLTTSGFTVLPWNYDVATATPRLERVVNAADGTSTVAPGSLISIYGSNLSPINQASQEMPLPTALGESCLTVNGVPVPVLFVSPEQINGQLPFQVDGNVAMILRTPGGVSDTLNLTILPSAPGVFRNGVAGAQQNLPAVYRTSNGLLATDSNPVHHGDIISILLTGMGRTTPPVEAGIPAPADPIARVVIPATVSLGGVELPIESAGLLPNAVGVYQIQARVTSLVPIGLGQPLRVQQGSSSTSINLRVVQ